MTSDKRGEEKPVGTNVAVETSPQRRSALLFGDFELTKSVKEKDAEATEPTKVGIPTEENLGTTIVHNEPERKFLTIEELSENAQKGDETMEPVSVGIRAQDKHVTSTVVYFEPEMKFLRREVTSENEQTDVEAEESGSVRMETQQTTDTKKRSSENEEGSTGKGVEIQPEVEESKSVGLGTQEIPTIIYYEPEMKFLTRTKSSGNVTEVKELKTTEVQTQSSPEPVTVISFESEMKTLRRKDESGKRGVLPNEQTQLKEIERDTNDKSVGTEPDTLEDSEREGEEPKPNLTDTSQSYFNGSDSSNLIHVAKSCVSEELEQIVANKSTQS